MTKRHEAGGSGANCIVRWSWPEPMNPRGGVGWLIGGQLQPGHLVFKRGPGDRRMTSIMGFDTARAWDYENGFHLTSDITRIGKSAAHF